MNLNQQRKIGMSQYPRPDDYLQFWRGDSLAVELRLDAPRRGRAVVRTNVSGEWRDYPLAETAPGVYSAQLPLVRVGVFSGKTCFFPEDSQVPVWSEGRNFRLKVGSAEARQGNSIYCVFPRQFGSFREIVRRLPTIMDAMGFRILQTLPPFPVPTTYAAMGEYGCPFAATDFLSVDPAMAEFDEKATPLDQFRELIGAVHARDGRIFLDLPANHTGWASTLQTHHPEWFRREADGRFHSPGAWGVKWADLVELDYSQAGLREYMAEVFLFWCRLGVDGFRCDAGYMIPAEVWEYIVASVRGEYPDSVFLLEGLGGDLAVTDRLLSESGLDWAYSEIFQTYDRRQFEWYLPAAIARAEKYGTLVHFAETHDNDRLAGRGETYARLRVQLAALLSWQGAWGIANGVEWFATEKIDVHGRNDLNWGAERNQLRLIGRLNAILNWCPSFSGACHLEVVTRGGGNTLAVLRSRRGALPVLVLANLDCQSPVEADWDRTAFPHGAVRDLLTGEAMELSGPVTLAPGEVKCLQRRVFRVEDAPVALADVLETPFELAERQARDEMVFRLELPRDVRREVVVPSRQWIEVSAAVPFRLRVVDPASGKTLVVYRSVRNRVLFQSPGYAGDGTACRRLSLEAVQYRDGQPHFSSSPLLVPPPSRQAMMKLSLDAAEVVAHPESRAIVSNGAGAIAQVRAGWGTISSQYDSFLAANPDPAVPSDRLVVWTRTRCWLQYQGYSHELDAKCTDGFAADPAGRGAGWRFAIPTGLGGAADFVFALSLAEGRNAARLKVTRVAAGERETDGAVRLVFRPDLEWRSHHSVTKAYADGTEPRYAAAVHPLADGRSGFEFAPGEGRFVLTAKGGEFHPEVEWKYGVPHPEEAARGQDGCGDVFSPGWISADFAVGDTVELVGEFNPSAGADCHWGMESPPTAARMPLAEALRESLKAYIVRRDDLKTVIAGYPWFLDWGRDTFIFMRGMIAAGMLEDAVRILRAFAAFEDRGTLPNIIYGGHAGNRDTVDAPLWFIRCVEELGDSAVELKATCESIVANYFRGTPNGIRVDEESGLVWTPSHFTWMDTNYPACTPRVGYPVEIQALWISALRFLRRREAADRAFDSLQRFFRRDWGYVDCLAAPHGEPAAQAAAEDTIRPNQLLLITLGIVNDPAIVRSTECLLVPGGIRSLNAGHWLYRGVYAGDEDTSRKPAYHNGTAWGWQFPLFAEALVRSGMASREVALALLAGGVENLNSGCLCHLSEIADGDAPHAQKGCAAQAWSDSELLRVWLNMI